MDTADMVVWGGGDLRSLGDSHNKKKEREIKKSWGGSPEWGGGSGPEGGKTAEKGERSLWLSRTVS